MDTIKTTKLLSITVLTVSLTFLSTLVALLSACGGGGGGGGGGSSAAAVSSTSPVDKASDVARSSGITATFNEGILNTSVDASSFTLAKSSGENAAGNVSFDGANNIATFTPGNSLANLASYTATLSTAITDLSGNPVLASNYNWSFTTADGIWGSVEEIGNDLGNPAVPQIAVNNSGQAIAVWHQNDGIRTNIWVNHFNGTNWDDLTLIEGTNNGDASNPQVILDDNGNALAIWSQDDGSGNHSIWANRFNGTSWETNTTRIEAGTNSSDHATVPQITMDSNGNALAVWQQSNGGDTNIWANYFNGTSWVGAEEIESDAGFASNPQVAMSSNGKALAVWQQSDGIRDDIWINRFSGTSWDSDATQISTEDLGYAVEPQVAMNSNGNAQIVWVQDDGNRDNIWASRFNSNGSFSAAEIIETENLGNAFHVQIAIDSNDNAIAVWAQNDGSVLNIWANRFDGTNWLGAELIEEDDEEGGIRPQIAIDSSGNALAVWQQFSGSHYVIWANRFDGTNWLGTQQIELDNTKVGVLPQIAFDNNGNALAVWKQVDGTRKNIAARRFE